ncbi:MAG: Signal peptidase peptidase, partial [Planctomycetota bacterium]
VHYRSRGDAAPVVVPSNAVFILGDNPVASTDGRDFGTVSLDVLKGRALRGR